MRLAAVLVVAVVCGGALAQTSSVAPTSSNWVGVVTVESGDQATLLDTVWVEGTAFEVADSGEFRVSMSLMTGDYFQGSFVITNNTTKPYTFDPISIDAMAWKNTSKGGSKKIGLYTYPADEYVRDVENAADFRKAMLALSYGLRSASAHLSTVHAPVDQAVAQSVQRLADVAERQEAAQMASGIDQGVAVDADGLMRKHTILPGQTYAGRVMFGSSKGDTWEFEVRIGAKWFVFTFR